MHTSLSLFTFLRTLVPWARARLSSFALAFEPCRTPAPVMIPVRRPMPKSASVALAAVAALAIAAPAAHAARYRPDDRSSNYLTAIHGALVDVQVLVDGSGAPLYTRQASWNPW